MRCSHRDESEVRAAALREAAAVAAGAWGYGSAYASGRYEAAQDILALISPREPAISDQVRAWRDALHGREF